MSSALNLNVYGRLGTPFGEKYRAVQSGIPRSASAGSKLYCGKDGRWWSKPSKICSDHINFIGKDGTLWLIRHKISVCLFAFWDIHKSCMYTGIRGNMG